MKNINLDPKSSVHDFMPMNNTNSNPTCNSKQGTLEFSLPVVQDKIVVGNKKFDDISSAVKYLVKQSYQYSYNIQIKDIKPTPTYINVVAIFNYEDPTPVTAKFNIVKAIEYGFFRREVYYANNKKFKTLEDALKYLMDISYGKYNNLQIIKTSHIGPYYEDKIEKELIEVVVKFIDIPDVD